MTSPVSLAREGDFAVVCIDSPPVNAISEAVTAGLKEVLRALEVPGSYAGVILYCAGRTFVAGGDIAAFDADDFSARPFNEVLARIEKLAIPVVAAIHGTALGGGLELAMACHWRVSAPDAKFGMPEVKLGLLPGSLGTQRLPRLIGPELAFDLMSSGHMINAEAAREIGLVDAVREGDPRSQASAWLRDLTAAGGVARRTSDLSVEITPDRARVLRDKIRAAVEARPAYPAVAAIGRAVETALTGTFAEGERVEADLFEQLRRSNQSRALRHLFFAERNAAKVVAPGTVARTVAQVGILGAGIMGTGIAMNFLNAGISTVIVERAQDALDRGLAAIRTTYDGSVAKGRLSHAERDKRMGLLQGRIDDSALAGCDLVIEAVYEDMALKRAVCKRLGEICKAGAIIATNTSTLDVDRLAEATGRPGDVVGMHFFSPANIMRLLEVVRGARTSADVLATVMQIARRIGKVPVVSGVCYGFIGNRMAEVYMREAEFLLMEGAEPAQVDAAVEAIGMAMGPCRMLDMAGIDVGAKTVIEYGKAGGLPPDASYRAVVRKLYEMGRNGQKAGQGYYRYEGRKPVVDPELRGIVEALSAEHEITRRAAIKEQEIFERLMYPLINEGAKILEEGIALRAGDVDVVWTAGYGFPDHRGGPMFLADEIGLSRIADRLKHYAAERGNAFGYWTVSPLLQRLAQDGGRLSAWTSQDRSTS